MANFYSHHGTVPINLDKIWKSFPINSKIFSFTKISIMPKNGTNSIAQMCNTNLNTRYRYFYLKNNAPWRYLRKIIKIRTYRSGDNY